MLLVRNYQVGEPVLSIGLSPVETDEISILLPLSLHVLQLIALAYSVSINASSAPSLSGGNRGLICSFWDFVRCQLDPFY